MLNQLEETRRAFDSVAADYDGPRGNNDLIQDMRRCMWGRLHAVFPLPGRLIDLGCGTGLDAVHLGESGHEVTATDWSAQMVGRTQARAARAGVSNRVTALNIGAQELARLPGHAAYDGAYSNLGPLNCVPDLEVVSRECARLVKPGGTLVFTVIGRFCPWEIVHYALRGRWQRWLIRFAGKSVPVSMNRYTIWTRYYTPREFYRAFRREFAVSSYEGLCLFAPPPYLTWVREKYPRLHRLLWALDRVLARLPGFRSMGDHFLIVMRRR